MKRSNRRRRLVLTGLAATTAAAALAAPGAASAASHPLFSDASGDAAAPIDIRTVDVQADAGGIVITQRLGDVDGRAPLFASSPQYSVNFRYGPGIGNTVVLVSTDPGGTTATLTFGDEGFSNGGVAYGTSAVSAAANTVSLRFAYADLPDGLGPGTVLRNLTAGATYRQTVFANRDAAAAPSGFTYSVGQ